MKKFLFILITLMIFFKTGNVLSEQSIFTVNNLKMVKKNYNNIDDLTNDAFRKGFKKLNKKILLDKDFKKIEKTNLKTIKNLISHYQILNSNEKIENEFTEFNIFFKRDKIYNFYFKNDIRYSDISDKSLKILPVLIIDNEVLIYEKNYFYENWISDKEDNHRESLLEFILPIENIEVIDSIKKNRENLEAVKLSEIFDESKDKDNLYILIDYNRKMTKVFLKGNISKKKIIKNIKITSENNNKNISFEQILISLKKEILEMIKSQNIIDVRTPSFLNVNLLIKEQNDLLKTQNILNDEDLIESFYVNEFNNRIANIKIKYYGKINKITEKLYKRGLNFETDGESWKVRVN